MTTSSAHVVSVRFASGDAWWRLLLLAMALLSGYRANGALWQLGAKDGKNAEFALAPGRYGEFRNDAVFAVGRSDPVSDWPYAHPGPADAWGGSRHHTYSVLFGLKSPPAEGPCKLRVGLVDTHSQAPPELRVSLNGQSQQVRLPRGAGDHTIFGEPDKGKKHQFEVVFPGSALRSGANELALTTVAGSWMLYDWLEFETASAAELTEVKGTLVSRAASPPVLVERGSKLMQVIELTLRHFGPPVKAVVRVDNGTPNPVTLDSAAVNLDLTVPPVEQKTECVVTIEAEGQSTITQTVPLRPVRKWVVFLLPHSHVDIGYTHVQTEVEQAQWRYLEMAIEAARKSAGNPPGSRFKWNVEVLWAVDSYLKQASPEKRLQFTKAVQAGWVGLDALYGNQLTGLCREEELMRLLRFGSELAQRVGVPITSAMITDVPGYTWGIVPTFAQNGVKYFSIGPNGGDRIGHTAAAWGDKPFWWIGPNGRDKVLVWMTGTGYYQVFRSPGVLQDYLSGLEAKGYPYDLVQVRHCLGDNGAPDVNFADTVKAWNDKYAYPRLVIATTAEMFWAMESRYGNELPVARGDFTPYWEDGAASSARETAMNRASADRLLQAQTMYALWRAEGFPGAEFADAWRDVLLYDEHTWGAHNSISQPDAPFVKSQWAIKQAFAIEADRKSRALYEKALSLRAPVSDVVKEVEVFNSFSGARTELATIPASWALGGEQVTDEYGQPIPSQRCATGELVFVARDVPGFGSRRYSLSKARYPRTTVPVRAAETSLSSASVKLRFDTETGGIKSLVWRKVRRDLVDGGASTGLNDYFYLPGTDLSKLQRAGSVKITVKEAGPVFGSVVIESEAPGCRGLTREVRLFAELDRIEFINTVDKLPVRAKEGVHFGFGLDIPKGTLRLDMPWSVVRPEADQLPGACKNWLAVQRWLDISNDRWGATLTTPDAPLFEVGGITANLVGSLSDPRAWVDKLEPSGTVYCWAMNNHWHTNYRAEQEGPTVFRFSLCLHEGFSAAHAASLAASWNQPLVVYPAGHRLAGERRLTIEGADVAATLLKPSDDGQALIVRLFAPSAKPQRAKLNWGRFEPVSVWWSDASEQPLTRLEGPVELPPYGVATIRANLK